MDKTSREHMGHARGLAALAIGAVCAILVSACGTEVTYFEGGGGDGASAIGGNGAGGNGTGGSGAAPTCGDPLVQCGNACVDVTSDPSHCGACYAACGPGQVCSGSACEGSCSGGLTDCDGSCVDTDNNPQHCGACWFPCPPGSDCVNAQCTPPDPCPPPLADCFGFCVDLQSDPFNCGGCGNTCSDDSVCTAGDCLPLCGPLTLCDGSCVDVLTDPQHCGGCNQPCAAGDLCGNGQCQCNDPVCGVCDVTDLGSTVPQTVGGTALTNHQEPSCAAPGGADSWFRFTAPMDGNYTLDTLGSNYDTVLYIVDSSGCFEAACNDDDGGLTSKLTFDMAAGEEVLVVVDGYGGDSGNFVLNIDMTIVSPCPFADLGSTVPQTVSGSTVGMSADYTGLCAGNGPEVSYSFTAPQTGNYLITTEGSSFDTVLYVHDSSCGGPPMACNDDYNGLTSLIYMVLQENQTVVVFVDSFSSPGSYVLNLFGPM